MDPATFAQLNQNAEASYANRQVSRPKAQTQKKKGPGGVEGFLINSLPAIGGGLGAVAGIPLDIFGGAGSIVGGAAGAGLGEALKRKALGEKQDIGQIGIQALEGGALSGVGSAVKGASSLAKGFVNPAAKAATEATASTAERQGGGFLKNLTTQGQQMQGRVTGVSAGSKAAGKELVPQDTERMLQTLKNEGINTGNANNSLRDVVDKMKGYGQQIGDHFKTNNAPLHTDDTKQVASNFINGLETTDPGVLKQAQILAADLQKNVKDTQGLWKFRKSLDDRIPDTKQGATLAVSNKVAAVKNMRQYIAKELGEVPGMSGYHDLAEIKPFLSSEAKRLNNPGGGIAGRLLASGPVQKAEALTGKATEKIGKIGSGSPPPIDPTDPVTPVGTGFLGQLLKAGKGTATLPVRAAAAPLAYPGKSLAQVGKQELGRGFGIPAALSQGQQQSNDQSVPDVSASLAGAEGAQTPDTTNDPFDPSNVQANVQRILAQGGKMKDVSDYLSNVKAYQELTSSSSKPLNSTQQQQANNAQSGLDSLSEIAQTLQSNPNASKLADLPGGSLASSLTGTGSYKAAVNNATDVIGRLRSGGAINADEEKRFKSLLPGAFDDSETVNYKLNQLGSLFQKFVNPAGGASDASDALSSLGY